MINLISLICLKIINYAIKIYLQQSSPTQSKQSITSRYTATDSVTIHKQPFTIKYIEKVLKFLK